MSFDLLNNFSLSVIISVILSAESMIMTIHYTGIQPICRPFTILKFQNYQFQFYLVPNPKEKSILFFIKPFLTIKNGIEMIFIFES